ncbi:YaaW family protein [Vibrio agarivorans]|uniref:YaaW family protein n=1 Tax=Vibrio agarivorans TaxID=153622 RepID=UPI0025B292E6|nr:ubiquinol-cytochrome C chaperone family protein [Vibrio agarivorans]MDN3663145.1 ubiquinol-cytochrome C chaperone family protein [Vibrio agarivorans]
MKNTNVYDYDLNPVLEASCDSDLAQLVDFLKKKTSEELTKQDAYKLHAPNHSKYADLIAKEIRDMGGNTFANMMRGWEGPSYHEIVCNVADKLKVPYNKSKDTSLIEDSILEAILKRTLDSMSEEERQKLLEEVGADSKMSKGGATSAVLIAAFRAGGFKSYQLTLIIANEIAKFILGRGLSFATNRTITKLASILSGPIGWTLSGIWTAYDIAGPAYRVTIPCVIHIAMLRKKMNSLQCEGCGSTLLDPTVKFCPECGTKQAA